MRTDSVTITHHGTRYAFGRGADYFGIWRTGEAPGAAPVERFADDRAGWYEGWARYQELETARAEVPGPVGSPAPDANQPFAPAPSSRAVPLAAVLVAAGVGVGVAGLFPLYSGDRSLASQSYELTLHLVELVGWALAGIGLLDRRTARIGALFGLGLSAVTFGLLLGDVGIARSPVNTGGAGLTATCVSWLLCAAGVGYGTARTAGRHLSGVSLDRSFAEWLTAAVVAILAGATFLPGWDRYTLDVTSSGQVEHVVEGNAFSNPGLAITGFLLAIAALVLVAGIAVTRRDRTSGAALLLGGALAMIAQIWSAVVQIGRAPALSQFGISSSEAQTLGVRVTGGLTPDFYLFTAAVAMLVAIAGSLAVRGGRQH